MPKSADETAGPGDNLHDDSDVIELTEEIPPGKSNSKDAQDQQAEDELDALTRDMPEFRVPDQNGGSDEDAASDGSDDADDEIVELRDTVESDGGGAIPSAAILSGRKSNRKKRDEAKANEPSEAGGGDEIGYDRQEMVKTIQMTAIDRREFERQVQAEEFDESTLLLDHSYSPDVVVFPPRVLTTRWREGGPLLRAGKVELASDEAREEVEGGQVGEPTATDEVDESNLDEEESEAVELGPEDEIDEELEDIEKLDDDDLPEIEPDALEIELDSEAIEDAGEVKPPPKPAPQKTPPPQNREARASQQSGKKPQRNAAKPASAQDDDAELSGLVQELLDESKQAREQKRKKAQKPRSPRETWFQKVFTEEYLRTLPKDIHRQTKREVDFIESSFDLGENDRLLDLACGFGRHSIELTRRGHEVAGLDLSMPLLQKALNEAQKQSLSIKFIHGDMRELSFEGIFSGCFIWQTSFGFFDDQTNFRVLRGIHRALRPGGRLLIDVLNRDHIVTKMPHRLWWEGVDCVFLEEVELDHRSSVLHTKRSFIYEDGSPPLEQNTFIRLYSLHELRQLLRAAGFAVREVSGELHHRGQFLGPASSRLIVQAQKRPPKGRK